MVTDASVRRLRRLLSRGESLAAGSDVTGPRTYFRLAPPR